MIRYDFCDNTIHYDRRLVFKDGKYGFIDEQGNEVIPLKFDFAIHFVDSYAIVAIGNKYGTIDKNGNIVIPLKYSYLRYIYPKYYIAGYNGKYKLINLDGTDACSQLFDKPFNDCRVCIDGKYGVWKFDEEIKQILPAIYESIYDYRAYHYIVKNNGKYGVVDNNNNVILDVIYDEIRIATITIAENKTELGFSIVKDGLCGFASDTGEILIPAEYKQINYLDGPRYKVIDTNNAKGIYNIESKVVLSPQYYDIYAPFCIIPSEQKLFIFNNGVQSYLGYEDGTQIPNSDFYYMIRSFSNNRGLFKVRSLKAPHLWGIIDYTGKVILDCIYDDLTIEDRNIELIIASKGDIVKYFNYNGDQLLSSEDFDSIVILGDTFKVCKDNKYGLCDSSGKLITKIIYDNIYYNYMADIEVIFNGTPGYISRS